VSDERRLRDTERSLRSVPPPEVVPPYLAGIARAEALAEAPAGRGGRITRARGLLGALLAAALAVSAIAVAVAVVLAGDDPGVASTLTMNGTGDARGVVEIGEAKDGARSITIKVEDLPPVRDGYWYSVHYHGEQGQTLDAASFNVNTNGEAEIRTSYAADSTWSDCWVVRHAPDGDEQRVLWVEGDGT
jgi:hypothetical protein